MIGILIIIRMTRAPCHRLKRMRIEDGDEEGLLLVLEEDGVWLAEEEDVITTAMIPLFRTASAATKMIEAWKIIITINNP